MAVVDLMVGVEAVTGTLAASGVRRINEGNCAGNVGNDLQEFQSVGLAEGDLRRMGLDVLQSLDDGVGIPPRG